MVAKKNVYLAIKIFVDNRLTLKAEI